jgi:hypothetical protein
MARIISTVMSRRRLSTSDARGREPRIAASSAWVCPQVRDGEAKQVDRVGVVLGGPARFLIVLNEDVELVRALKRGRTLES